MQGEHIVSEFGSEHLAILLQVGQIIAYLLVAATFVIMLKADMRVLRNDLSNLKHRQDALGHAFEQLTAVLTKIAVQENRIKNIEDDIRELRHGRGYIMGAKEG